MADYGGLKTYKRMIVSTLKSYQVFMSEYMKKASSTMGRCFAHLFGGVLVLVTSHRIAEAHRPPK